MDSNSSLSRAKSVKVPNLGQDLIIPPKDKKFIRRTNFYIKKTNSFIKDVIDNQTEEK